VAAIKFLTNYAYWVQRINGTQGIFIDPGTTQYKPFFTANKISRLPYIFVTHKHDDHCSGVQGLADTHTKVYAGEVDAPFIKGCTNVMTNNETVEVDGLKITSILTSCHTLGHVMYLIQENDLPNEGIKSVKYHDGWAEYKGGINRALFTGDNIFAGGCGRFFEGHALDMTKIMDKVLKMPEDLYLFHGHEYSYDNAKFGLLVEPNNVHLQEFMRKAEMAKRNGEFVLPTTLRDEKNYNVFMRCRTKEIQKAVKSDDPVKCMDILRSAKNEGKFPIT